MVLKGEARPSAPTGLRTTGLPHCGRLACKGWQVTVDEPREQSLEESKPPPWVMVDEDPSRVSRTPPPWEAGLRAGKSR